MRSTSAYAGSFFSDASCTQHLAYVGKGACAPKYADTYELASCSPCKYHVFSLGSPHTVGSIYSGANCVAGNLSTILVNYDLYSVRARARGAPARALHASPKGKDTA